MYELAIMGIKNKLLAKQWRDIKEEKRIKRDLAVQLKNMEMIHGKFSEEYNRVDREMDNIINVELLNRAENLRNFLKETMKNQQGPFIKLVKTSYMG
jgi:hypothetical protein